MSKIISTIEGQPIILIDDGSVRYHAKAAIDSDGVGPHHGDHTAQDDTSLKLNGKSLNADVDCYIVVPPAIIRGVVPIVLGCQAHVTYKGRSTDAVVGDIGPRAKLGEISCATAIALGIDPSPVNGGVDSQSVSYVLWPGKAAVVNKIAYDLQPS